MPLSLILSLTIFSLKLLGKVIVIDVPQKVHGEPISIRRYSLLLMLTSQLIDELLAIEVDELDGLFLLQVLLLKSLTQSREWLPINKHIALIPIIIIAEEKHCHSNQVASEFLMPFHSTYQLRHKTYK